MIKLILYLLIYRQSITLSLFLYSSSSNQPLPQWKNTSPQYSPPFPARTSPSSHTMTDKWNLTTKNNYTKLSPPCIKYSLFALTFSSETSNNSSKTLKIYSSKFYVSQPPRNCLPLHSPIKKKTKKSMKRNKSPFWSSWYCKSTRCERPQQTKAEQKISKYSRLQWSSCNKKFPNMNRPFARKSTTTSWRKSWKKKKSMK